ncbi:amino acid ABC transporter substrate-binding protein, PAAT family [Burkholderia sp. GAS332]|nr:amino acid ABC transporter substrate-binding protein, PAAT family [Burkholderia sp. GAS332]
MFRRPFMKTLPIAASLAATLGVPFPAFAAMPVTVAILTTAPPFEYKDGAELKGFEVDLLQAIAAKEDLKLQYVEMKFEGMIPALQSHQVDVAAAGFFTTNARKAVLDFSSPHYRQGNVLATSISSPIRSFTDLKGATILAKKGAASVPVADKLAVQYGAHVKVLNDEPSMYMDVATGQSQALVNDSAVIAYKIKIDGAHASLRQVGAVLEEQDVAFAFPKGSALTKKFNEGLQKIKQNGEYKTIYSRYFAQ